MAMNKDISYLSLDQSFIEYNKFFKKIVGVTSVSGIEAELDTLIDKRGALKAINMALTDDYSELKDLVINSSIEHQILRSRLIYIKTNIYKNIKKLESYEEAIQKYLYITYKDQLDQAGFKTQTDKNIVIGSLFMESVRFISTLKSLDETLDFIIKDIDQQSWTLKNIISMMEIVFKNNKIL